MKSTRRLLLAAATLALAATAHAQEFVTILTGGTSGVYYPMGVALSQIYGKAMPGSKTSAQVTKASAENLNLLQAGRGEIGFSLGDSVQMAWDGNTEAGFPGKLDKLRGIAAIYPNYIQIVASQDRLSSWTARRVRNACSDRTLLRRRSSAFACAHFSK